MEVQSSSFVVENKKTKEKTEREAEVLLREHMMQMANEEMLREERLSTEDRDRVESTNSNSTYNTTDVSARQISEMMRQRLSIQTIDADEDAEALSDFDKKKEEELLAV